MNLDREPITTKQTKTKWELNMNGVLKPVYIISCLCGLSHFSYKCGTTTPIDLHYYHKIYRLINAILAMTLCIWSLHGKYTTTTTAVIPMIILVDFISTLLESIVCFFQLMSPIICCKSDLKNVMLEFKNVDKNLEINTQKYYRGSAIKIVMELVVVHFIFFSLMSLDTMLWAGNIGFELGKYYFVRFYATYLRTITTVQITTLSCHIRRRFILINEKLKSFTPEENNRRRSIFTESDETESMVQKVHLLRKTHDQLCDMAELVNHAFGFFTLLFMLEVVTNVVHALFLALMIATRQQIVKESAVALTLVTLFWAVYMLILIASITGYCQYVGLHANKTGVIASKLLLVPSLPEAVHSEVTLFAQQVPQRALKFTACGFFTIDFSLMYTIIGAIGTYLIVLVQFHTSCVDYQFRRNETHTGAL